MAKRKAVCVVKRYAVHSPLLRPIDVPDPVATLALRKARKLSSKIDRRAARKLKAEADRENRAVLAESHKRELADARQAAFVNGKSLWLSLFELRRTRSIGRAWMTACLITWLALAVTLLV